MPVTNLRSKFALYLLGFFVLLILDTWILYYNFARVSEQEGWVKHTYSVLDQLEMTTSSLKDAEIAARRFGASAKPEANSQMESALTSAFMHFHGVKSLTADNLVQQEYGRETENLLQDRANELRKFAQSFAHSTEKQSSDNFLQTEARYRDLLLDIDAMKTVESDLLALRSRQSEESRELFPLILLFTAALNVLVALIAFRQTVVNQRRIDAEKADQFKRSRDAEELSRAASMMTGEISMTDCAISISQYLSDVYGAAAVRVYVKTMEEIREVGDFGVSPAEKEKLHEGLVAEGFKKRELWTLDHVPEVYWRIRSGLGSAVPSQIVFVPLIFQKAIVGLVELATFFPFRPETVLRLEKVSEIFATGLNAAVSRYQLQNLLEQTMRQSEELQTQQEELRTNNEELEQQARAMEVQQQALGIKNRELEVAQVELEGKARDLAKSSKYKSEFLAKMSHELRTPLNGLLILSTLLIENKEKTLTEQQQNFAQSIQNAGNDLLTLINDILDLSKIEARKLTLHPTAFTLGEIFASERRTFEPQTQAKGLQLRMDLDPAAENVVLFTDRQRVDQILRNFISNALKFTDTGSITISANLDQAQKFITFEIADTGMGIPKNKQELIFEAFEQADTTVSGQFGGTGLGLTISRELATLLGGEISMESEERKGSKFRLRIPLKVTQLDTSLAADTDDMTARQSESADHAKLPGSGSRSVLSTRAGATTTTNFDESTAERAARKAIASRDPDKKSIMIVEDDDNFRLAVVETVRSYGFDPIAVGDGEVALKILNIHTPDAILLDIKLPGISGLGILEMIKQAPHLRHIPVHMISGLNYQQNALKMGALGYLTKPVTTDKVKSALGRIESLLSDKLRRVLIIEDNERQNFAITQLISGRDIEVVSARTGGEGLKKLREGFFDCVILDLTLPDISGFDILSEIRSLDVSLPPVVVYTGKELSDEEQQYLSKYSESIIIKGAKSPERLLDEVNLFLHRVESLLPAEKREMLSGLRSREKSYEGRVVLVVDDDVRNIFAMTSALEAKGLVVRVARNGEEALRSIEQHSDIDLVLMDIMMPKMDGYEAITRIRQSTNPRIKSLPVIALTAKAMREDHERCMEAGANDFLTKPLNLENLATVMKVWLVPARFEMQP